MMMSLMFVGGTVTNAIPALSNYGSVITVSAADDDNNQNHDVTKEARTKMKGLINDIVDIIGFVALGIGAIMAGYGIIQLIMAMTDNNGESKKQAAQFLVIGVVLIFAKYMLTSMDLGQYFSESTEESGGTGDTIE